MESGVPYSLSTDSNGTALLMNTNSPTTGGTGWIRWKTICTLWICCSPAAHAGNSDEPGPPPVSEAAAPDAASSEAEGVPALAPDPCRDEDRQASLDRLVALWQAGDLQGLRTQSLLVVHDHAYPEAAYLGGLSLVGQGESTEAMAELSGLAAAYPGQPIGWRSRLALAEHLRDAAPAAAVPVYGALLQDEPPDPVAQMAWRGQARAHVALGQLPAAADMLSGRSDSDLAVLTESVEGARRWRSPTAAKGLAVVPGLGHLYAGSPRQALSAFIVNSVFMSGVGYAASREAWGVAGVLGFFGAGFYLGNFYGAADAARRHNQKVVRSIDRGLESAGWQPAPIAMPTGDWNPACVQAPD